VDWCLIIKKFAKYVFTNGYEEILFLKRQTSI